MPRHGQQHGRKRKRGGRRTAGIGGRRRAGIGGRRTAGIGGQNVVEDVLFPNKNLVTGAVATALAAIAAKLAASRFKKSRTKKKTHRNTRKRSQRAGSGVKQLPVVSLGGGIKPLLATGLGYGGALRRAGEGGRGVKRQRGGQVSAKQKKILSVLFQ